MLLELVVALAILTTALLPLGFMFSQEQKLCRASYSHAVAMELVDGETEILAAGEWRAFKQGSQPYTVQSAAARNLPPGRFVLLLQGKRLRLEWTPEKTQSGGRVSREVMLR